MKHIYPTHEEATEYVKQQGWSYENEFNEKEFERLTKLHYSDDIPIDDLKKLGMIWNAYFNYRMTKKK